MMRAQRAPLCRRPSVAAAKYHQLNEVENQKLKGTETQMQNLPFEDRSFRFTVEMPFHGVVRCGCTGILRLALPAARSRSLRMTRSETADVYLKDIRALSLSKQA